MPEIPKRKDLHSSFEPIVPTLREVIASARMESRIEDVQQPFPTVGRLAHYRRLRGTVRWMVICELLRARAPGFPEGFGLASTELDHNQSRYAFRFPLGIFTVKREPHDETAKEGTWFTERLEGIAEQAALAPDVDAFAGVKAYVSVPAEGSSRLIFDHPTLEEPIQIALDEFGDQSVPPFRGGSGRRRTPVRSTLATQREGADTGRTP